MTTPVKRECEEMERFPSRYTQPSKGEKNSKRNSLPSLYPLHGKLESGNELRALLVKTKLDQFYSCIDWAWHPAEYVSHFALSAKVLSRKQGSLDVVHAIKYFPRNSGIPVFITMEKMAKIFGLSLDGHHFDAASVEEFKEQNYFRIHTAKSGEQFIPLATAKSEALKILARFAYCVIYLQKKAMSKISMKCLKHLELQLRGSTVAWGKILWKSFLKRIEAIQSKRMYTTMDRSVVTRDAFPAVVVALLLHMELDDHPFLKAWRRDLKSTKPSEDQVNYELSKVKVIDNDDESSSDSDDDQNTDEIDGKNGLKQDVDMTDNDAGQTPTGVSMVDHLTQQVEDSKLEVKQISSHLPGGDKRSGHGEELHNSMDNDKIKHEENKPRRPDPPEVLGEGQDHSMKNDKIKHEENKPSRLNPPEVLGEGLDHSMDNDKIKHEEIKPSRLNPSEVLGEELDHSMDNDKMKHEEIKPSRLNLPEVLDVLTNAYTTDLTVKETELNDFMCTDETPNDSICHVLKQEDLEIDHDTSKEQLKAQYDRTLKLEEMISRT